MVNFVNFIYQLMQNPYSLLGAEVVSICFKIFLLFLVLHNSKEKTPKRLIITLSLVLIGELFSDLAWILRLLNMLELFAVPFKLGTFIIRIAWAFCVIQYYALALFIEYLVNQKFVWRVRHYIFGAITTLLASFYVGLAIFNFNIEAHNDRLFLEIIGIKVIIFYMFVVAIPSIYSAIRKINAPTTPRILQHQGLLLIFGIILPKLVMEFIVNNPLSFCWPFYNLTVPEGNYSAIVISTFLMIYAIYFATRKMMGLRFLNFTPHVQQKPLRFNFITDFKKTLLQLGQITNVHELKHITQNFFKDAFGISVGKAGLYIRALDYGHDSVSDNQTRALIVENFITTHLNNNLKVAELLQESKIFIKDEIEFTNFYENNETHKIIIDFLNSINADVFLPIYERNSLLGYIILEHDARKALYSATDRDEMVVFANYLSALINLLRNRTLESLMVREKDLTEELYYKHQEINQYKESIRSFLRTASDRKIGIVFFKHKKFMFGNQAAQELIGHDINLDYQHPVIIALKNTVRQVQEYKTAQTNMTHDDKGNKLVISALPSLDDQQIIITVYYPEIADVVKKQFDILKDPSQWDYLLYLETTESGQLINQLIPGTGQTLLQFKINLLKTALNKKATLLQIPEEDLLPTVELLHHISLRQQLQVIKLTGPEKQFEVALQLFGINPLLSNTSESLLEKFSTTGTIYIENIHFLHVETQKYLAEFIRYGYFHIFKSDRTLTSSARIICSSNKNLANLVEQGTFSATLFNELAKMTVQLPMLSTLSPEELQALADGFMRQAIKTKPLASLIELNDKEKTQLVQNYPVSIQELKERVHALMLKKSQQKKLDKELVFDPAYSISDPELVDAVRLGKHALKDQKIMTLLWEKFKNQTKIATLLRVNRSSVNRRCKEYGLISIDEI